MEETLDRFLILIALEGTKMPWLEKQTGISSKIWSNIKYKAQKMKAEELAELGKVYPEYAYWLTTGLELPEAGQISPMTKRASNKLKNQPTAG